MLAQLYSQKLSLFEKMGELSVELAQFSTEQLVEENHLEQLEMLLQKRACFVNEINVLDQKLINLGKQEPAGTDPKVQVFKKSLRKTGGKIQDQNLKLEGVVRAGLEELRTKTKNLRQKRKSGGVYRRPKDAGQGFFVDKRR